MEAWLVSWDGSRMELPVLLKWEFSYAVGSPCDSFALTCLWEQGAERALEDAVELRAVHEGETVFRGRVDEYACIRDGKGSRLEVSGRGMQALLLDNESLPMEYQLATVADVLANHVAPYGIETVGGGLRAVEKFVVESGQSQWNVVRQFACAHNGIVPRFDREGRLVLSGWEDDVRVLGDGVPVTGLRWEKRRYGVLSQVVVRDRARKVTETVTDQDFTAKGGCCRRVITTPRRTGSAAMRDTARYQMRVSRAEEVQCVVDIPRLFAAWPGELVELNRAGFGGNGRYRVAEAVTGVDQRGRYTKLVLGPEDLLI